jgi:hypothetical protein
MLIGLQTLSNDVWNVLSKIFILPDNEEDIRPRIRDLTRQDQSIAQFHEFLDPKFLPMAEDAVEAYTCLIGGRLCEDRTLLEVIWNVYSRLIFERPMLLRASNRTNQDNGMLQWITEATTPPPCERLVSVTLREYRAQDATRRLRLHTQSLLTTIDNLFDGKDPSRCYLLECHRDQQDTFMTLLNNPELFVAMKRAACAYEVLAEFVPFASEEETSDDDWVDILWDNVMRTIYENASFHPDTFHHCLNEVVTAGMSTKLFVGICPTTATSKAYRMQYLLHRIDVAASSILQHIILPGNKSFTTFHASLSENSVSDITDYARTYLDYHHMALSADMSNRNTSSLSDSDILKDLWDLVTRSVKSFPHLVEGKDMSQFRTCLHDLGPCIASRAYLV